MLELTCNNNTVLSILNRDALVQYVTVSRLLQHVIERYAFVELSLNSTHIKYFSDHVVGHRSAALIGLGHEVILPTYSGNQ